MGDPLIWLKHKDADPLISCKILKREGINHPGQATMEEFKGFLDSDII